MLNLSDCVLLTRDEVQLLRSVLLSLCTEGPHVIRAAFAARDPGSSKTLWDALDSYVKTNSLDDMVNSLYDRVGQLETSLGTDYD